MGGTLGPSWGRHSIGTWVGPLGQGNFVADLAAWHLATPLDLPLGELVRRVGALPGAAILEGGAGFGHGGRWSVYTAEPILIFEADDHGWRLIGGVRPEIPPGDDPLQALASLLDQYALARPEDAPDPDAPPFRGGLIGFFSYDLAPRLERLPRRAPADSRMPTIRFGLYDWAATVDHRDGRAQLEVFDLDGQGGLSARLRDRERRLRRDPEPPRPSILEIPEPIVSRSSYLDAVGQALEYIRAGDIFQVNLSQRFDAQGSPEPLDLYTRLRARSPAPFSAFLSWDDLAILSASPEWFYRSEGDRLVTRPIKGTRPRGSTPAEDLANIEALVASPKDRAELTMIVDLERNDLGRVCRYGSVRVTDPWTLESYAQVHHLVATVEGQIREGAGPVDIVRALFPGGSITGAPKIRAMEIIDELEPTRRGVYTGSIGYFGKGGTSAFNIAIRTLLVEGPRVSYQVGGGIVADSLPDSEYQETLHKGQGLHDVVSGWGLRP